MDGRKRRTSRVRRGCRFDDAHFVPENSSRGLNNVLKPGIFKASETRNELFPGFLCAHERRSYHVEQKATRNLSRLVLRLERTCIVRGDWSRKRTFYLLLVQRWKLIFVERERVLLLVLDVRVLFLGALFETNTVMMQKLLSLLDGRDPLVGKAQSRILRLLGGSKTHHPSIRVGLDRCRIPGREWSWLLLKSPDVSKCPNTTPRRRIPMPNSTVRCQSTLCILGSVLGYRLGPNPNSKQGEGC